MAISAKSVGSWAASNATTQTVTLPTHAAGDMLIVRAGCKPYTATPTISTDGWQAVGTGYSNGTTGSGNGTGSVEIIAFWKIATSSSETNPVVDWGTTSTPGQAVAVCYQKASTEVWVTPTGAGGGDDTARTSQTATISSHITVTAGDMVDFFVITRDDSAVTVPTVTQAGVTFGTVAVYPATAFTTATSNDGASSGGYRLASSGTSSAAAVVTHTNAATESGAAWQTRLRAIVATDAPAEAAAATASAQDTTVTTSSLVPAQTASATGAGSSFSFTDNFNRATENLSGGVTDGTWAAGGATVWAVGSGGTANQAEAVDPDSGSLLVFYSWGEYLAHTKAEVTWIQGDFSVTTRHFNDFYGFGRNGAGTWRLIKSVGLTITQIGSGAYAESSGDPISVKADSTTITGAVSGFQIVATDTAVAPTLYSYGGLYSHGADCIADDFTSSVIPYSLTPFKQVQPTPSEAAATASALDATVDTVAGEPETFAQAQTANANTGGTISTATDLFDRANSGTLGSDWYTNGSDPTFSILGNSAKGTSGAVASYLPLTGVGQSHTYAEATWTAEDGFVLTRCTNAIESSLTAYSFGHINTNSWLLRKYVSGVMTVLGSSFSASEGSSAVVRVEVDGSKLWGSVNGALAPAVTDTSIPVDFTTSYNGLYARSVATGALFADFTCGNLAPGVDASASIEASAGLVFLDTGTTSASGPADTFNRTDAATLGASWSEEGSGFLISFNQAVSEGGPLIATYTGNLGTGDTLPVVYGMVSWLQGQGGVFINSPSSTPTLATLSAYSVELTGTGTFHLAKYTSGVKTIFGTYSGDSTSGWYLTIRQVSSALYAYFEAGYPGGTARITVTDTSAPLTPNTNYYGGLVSRASSFAVNEWKYQKQAAGFADAAVKTEVFAPAQVANAYVNFRSNFGGAAESWDRADDASLGVSYNQPDAPGFKILSNQCVSEAADQQAYRNLDTTAISVQATDAIWVSGNGAVTHRSSVRDSFSTSTLYEFGRHAANDWRLRKVVSGTATTLGTYTGSETSGWHMGVRCDGPTISGHLAATILAQDSVPVVLVTDTSIPYTLGNSYYSGIRSYGVDFTIDYTVFGGFTTSVNPSVERVNGAEAADATAAAQDASVSVATGLHATLGWAKGNVNTSVEPTDASTYGFTGTADNLGVLWNEEAPGFSCDNGTGVADGYPLVATYKTATNKVYSAPTLYAEVDSSYLNAPSWGHGVFISSTSDTNTYAALTAYAVINEDSNRYTFLKFVSGVKTDLGSWGDASASYAWRFAVRQSGSSIMGHTMIGGSTNVLQNWNAKSTVTDTSIQLAPGTNYYCGLLNTRATGMRMDNFSRGHANPSGNSITDAGVVTTGDKSVFAQTAEADVEQWWEDPDWDPIVSVVPDVEAAAATASALDATVDATTTDTNADAIEATATASAEDATVSIAVRAQAYTIYAGLGASPNTDSFDRADSSTLGGSWFATGDSPGFSIVSNSAVADAADQLAVKSGSVFGQYVQRSQIRWEAGTGSAATRITSSAAVFADVTCYEWGRFGANDWRLRKVVSGTATTLANYSGSEGTSWWAWIRADGSLITGHLDASGNMETVMSVVNVTDTAIPGVEGNYYYSGMRSFDTAFTASHFDGGYWTNSYNAAVVVTGAGDAIEATASALGLDATVDAVNGSGDANADAIEATATATAEDPSTSIASTILNAAMGHGAPSNASGYQDSFNRTNAADLGSSWTEEGAGFSIVSNQAVSDGGPLVANYELSPAHPAPGTNPGRQAFFRWYAGLGGVFHGSAVTTATLADLTAFSAELTGVGQVALAKYVSGVKTLFGAYSGSSTAGWYLSVDLIGSVLKARFAASVTTDPVIIATDTSISDSGTRYAGIISASSGLTVDDFGVYLLGGSYSDAAAVVVSTADAAEATATASALDATVSVGAAAEVALGYAVQPSTLGTSTTFSLADRSDLTTIWNEEPPGFSIVSGQAVSDGGPLVVTKVSALTATTWAKTSCSVDRISGFGGVFMTSPDANPTFATLTAYSCELYAAGTYQLAKYVSGVKTVFGTYSGADSSVWTLAVSQTSSLIAGYFGSLGPDGTPGIVVTDTSLPMVSGGTYRGGMLSLSAGFTVDQFIYQRKIYGSYADAAVKVEVPAAATEATATASALDATVSVEASDTGATATASALDATVDAVDGSTDTNAQAVEATATATAEDPNPAVQASAEYVYLDGLVSVQAGGHVAPSAEEATATASALDLTSSVSPSPAEAAATALANDVSQSGTAQAVEATATALGLDATASVGAAAAEATGSATAQDVGRAATLEVAAADAAGQDATGSVGAAAQEAAATAAAHGTTADLSTTAEVATASALALDATTSVSEVKNVDAIEATATASANDVTQSGTAQAVEATASALGLDATPNYSSSPTAQEAAATAAAQDLTALVSTFSEAAAGSAAAQDPAADLLVPASEATATATAQDLSADLLHTPSEAAASALGLDPTISTDSAITAQAVTADAAAAAQDVTSSVSTEAQEAAGSVTADAAASVAVPAEEATLSALGLDATATLSAEVLAEHATATAEALDATPITSTSGDAQTADATAAALDAAAAVAPEAQSAESSALANDVSESGTAQAIEATATADALDATANWSSEVLSTEATALGSAEDPAASVAVDATTSIAATAEDPSSSVTVQAEEAAASALALDATATTAGVGEAFAQSADATATAQDAATDVTATAEAATATVEAGDVTGPELGLDDPTVSLAAASIEATATAAALDVAPETSTSVFPEVSGAAAAALDAAAAVDVQAEAATASADANDAFSLIGNLAYAECAELQASAQDAQTSVGTGVDTAAAGAAGNDNTGDIATGVLTANAAANALDAIGQESGTVNAPSEAAEAAIAAFDATTAVAATPETTATASALNATVSTSSNVLAQTAEATATAYAPSPWVRPSVTLPAEAIAESLDVTGQVDVYAYAQPAYASGTAYAVTLNLGRFCSNLWIEVHSRVNTTDLTARPNTVVVYPNPGTALIASATNTLGRAECLSTP